MDTGKFFSSSQGCEPWVEKRQKVRSKTPPEQDNDSINAADTVGEGGRGDTQAGDDNFVVSAGIFPNRCHDISSAHAGRWQEGHYGTILPPKTATLDCE